MKNLVSGRLLV